MLIIAIAFSIISLVVSVFAIAMCRESARREHAHELENHHVSTNLNA